MQNCATPIQADGHEFRDRALCLAGAIERLSSARNLEEVVETVRASARRIADADGVTFVLREGDKCHYVAENAISPLWAGQRFPMTSCISGWCMLNGRVAVIPNICADSRIPHGAYRPTFVKSLVMTPVGADAPVAAIGAYWATRCEPDAGTVSLLETLARCTATALTNVQLYTSLSASERQARQQLAELEALYRTAPAGLALLDRDQRYVRINDALAQMNGAPVEAHIGRTVREMVPNLADTLQPVIEQVLETGDTAGPVELSGETARLPGQKRAWLQYLSPVKDAGGHIQGFAVSALDITGRKQAEETQRLLMGELNHRVKNMLATVQAIARQTLKTSKDPASFIADFEGRLFALSKAHELLSDANWTGANLADLVAGQLAVLDLAGDKAGASGPPVVLAPQTAQSVGLVIHELASNACKHGALSVPCGRVRVTWAMTGEKDARGLTLNWMEQDGPAVAPPKRRGLGSLLIEHSLGAVGGSTRLTFPESGAVAELYLPLEAGVYARYEVADERP